jgi:hypothetical protein
MRPNRLDRDCIRSGASCRLAWTARLVVCVLMSVAGMAPRLAAQDAAEEIVDRAVAYVAEFQRRLGSVVSEERYHQSASEPSLSGRPGPLERVTLRSDFLLLQVPGRGWTPFRDVFERNGVRVRDREERLAKLFLQEPSQSALEQARKIVSEGTRYNLGSIERTINVPTLPLNFLTEAHRLRFTYEVGKRDEREGTVVEFQEVKMPTYILTTGGRNLPVSGRFRIDEATGVVRSTELDAEGDDVEAHVKVTYRYDSALDMWVPVRMDERYRDRNRRSEVWGVATYSHFRRFMVSTSEELTR